jgi:tetratricopeptide (TPR) repeat protein
MVSCKHCSTQNSLDSTFCKRCGTSIDETALEEAKTKFDGLIEEGNGLFNAGRTEEALAVADACVTANPSSVPALSLKALCHERKHEIAEALECAERIVDLNPDSELDKIKRNALRTRLQADLRPVEEPDRRMALAGAFAVIVLVGCIGLGIWRITSTSTPTSVAMNDSSTIEGAGTGGFQNPGTANMGTQASNAATDPNQSVASTPNDGLNRQPGPGDVPPINNAQPQNPAGNARRETPYTPPVRVPNLDSLPSTGGSVEPVRPEFEIRPEGGSSEPARPTPPQGRNTQPEDPQDLTGPKEEAPKKTEAEDTGVIEISVRGGAPAPRGNEAPRGTTPINENGLETLMRVGSQQYQIGNYSAAARNYEQAVRSGGDAIILNQRLGQAYERLGRTSEAADAYRRCIAACDAAMAGGRGDRSRLEQRKATAQQALKVLQGG